MQPKLQFKPMSMGCFPRFQQGMMRSDTPLGKYSMSIYASNCQRSAQPLSTTDITPLEGEDGLIYYLTKLTHTKILICVSMYNESRHAIQSTLTGIYNNLQNLQQYGISSQQIVVILIQDGILKLVSDIVTRKYVNDQDSLISFYREIDARQGKQSCQLEQRIHVILDQVDNYHRKGLAHLFHNNQQFPPSIQHQLAFVYQNLWKPTQNQHKYHLKIITCFKHTNGTKLSSHLWFFQGFCRQLNPQICILLDVGTKPASKSILKFMQCFEDKNVGGVTGFMSVDSSFRSEQADYLVQSQSLSYLRHCMLSIEGAQQFEYIMSHLMDKNYESALGFLQVLPGAWSGYRYLALTVGCKFEQNLLEHSYFKKLLCEQQQQSDYAEANMYLAQDRILSLGIFCQQNHHYVLKYVPDAFAYTEPMKHHQQLMVQRRRWINSSYFAFQYVLRNYKYHIMESDHNWFTRFILLNLSMLLALLSFVNGYLAPAFYCFALYTTIIQSGSNLVIDYAAEILTLIYIFMILISVIWSLYGSQWTKQAHYISYIFTSYTILLMGLVIWNICGVYLQLQQLTSLHDLLIQLDITIVFLITTINIVVYLSIAIVHIPTHGYFMVRLLVNCINYLSFQGAYSHVMLIYAFCNVDDVSWGTKGNSGIRLKQFLSDKVKFVARWYLLYYARLFTNAIVGFILLYIDIFIPRQQNKGIALLIMGIYATTILFIKAILAVYHQLHWSIFRCCSQYNPDPTRVAQIKQYWHSSYTEYMNLMQ